MKIVFIPHLPTLFGRRYNLAKNLAKQGHEVHFITWDMPYPLKAAEVPAHMINAFRSNEYKDSPNFYVHQVRRLPFFWPIINGLLFKYQVKKIYKKVGAQVIISQTFTNETEPPLNLPLVYDINDDHQAFADIYGSAIYRIGYKLLGVKSVIARQSAAALFVSVVSGKLETFAKRYNSDVIKIPNGVEEEAFTFSEKEKINARRHSIVYVSNFGKWSRLDEVLRTVNELKKSYPDIRLDLVGDGTELENAKKKTQVLDLKKQVTFHGKVNDRKKIFKLISAAEICLNISDKNAFRDSASPIKVIEYSALNKKVISTKLDEVSILNFPNVVFLSGSGSNNLKELVERAFSKKSEHSTARVNRNIMSEYTWENLTKGLSYNLERVLS